MSPRDRILSRRARFIAAALAATSAGSLAACGGKTDEEPAADTGPSACLSDAAACLGVAYDGGVDTGPSVCLEPALDTGVGPGDATGVDTGPTPCLDVAIDSGTDAADDTGPSPCLKVAPDTGSD